ncbi:MAG: bifunctional riboflavin kinase/FAD synthetase, partial [Gammaproteobacteria bacterium]
MELVRGSLNIRPEHHGCVATIGNYDGVHLGHQAVLKTLREQSGDLGLPSTVIIFEPQPQEFFMGDKAPARLTKFREKVTALDHYGADRVLVLRFNQRFRDLAAAQFIDELLVSGLGVKSLVVGDDFRFGRERAGDFAMLKQAGSKNGFSVSSMPTVLVDGERVSSTRVRKALAA